MGPGINPKRVSVTSSAAGRKAWHRSAEFCYALQQIKSVVRSRTRQTFVNRLWFLSVDTVFGIASVTLASQAL